MAPPSDVELWVDGKLVKTFRKESITEWYDEGEKVIFRARVQVPVAQKVELRFQRSRSRTKNFAIDEIVVQ